ncbi:MAG: TIGR04282 family arsenosugar biosynthesis glycosyltransferase [Acidobacteria bacterium]|nr:TIGR04282 family arsenosugar biosynthesis glycosyltransferase [Acidobacteriota bacterium]
MKVIAVMTRAPRTSVDAPDEIKTRLKPVLPEITSREALQRACLADVLTAARTVPGALVRVAVTRAGSERAWADLGVAPAHVLTQRGESLGERERGVFADLFRRGARQVVLVGSDVPTLGAAILQQAFAALVASPSHVVLGPAADGGYYLLGLAGPVVPDLFSGVRWSTRYALADTLRRCEFESRRVTFLPMLDDLDEPESLAHLRADLEVDPSRAPHTAAFLRQVEPLGTASVGQVRPLQQP